MLEPAQFVIVETNAAPATVRPAPAPPPIIAQRNNTQLRPPPAPPSLPVHALEEVHGIGPSTAKKLKDLGISTVEELILAGEGMLSESGLNATKAKEAFANAIRLLGEPEKV